MDLIIYLILYDPGGARIGALAARPAGTTEEEEEEEEVTDEVPETCRITSIRISEGTERII